jgi:hypothetical protein
MQRIIENDRIERLVVYGSSLSAGGNSPSSRQVVQVGNRKNVKEEPLEFSKLLDDKISKLSMA